MGRRANKITDVWRHVNMHGGDTEPCWEWKLALSGGTARGKPKPYFSVEGRKLMATRLIYEMFYGETLQQAQVIRHTCDNPWCCNPHHMIAGTHQENMDDMVERDRHGLPHHVVRNIRKLLKEGRLHRQVASLYGVDRSTVTRIANDQIHTHPLDYEEGDE